MVLVLNMAAKGLQMRPMNRDLCICQSLSLLCPYMDVNDVSSILGRMCDVSDVSSILEMFDVSDV